jgi:Protein of unknown function (DUF1107)
MKTFTINSLNQIVKYIKIFFEGSLEVDGLGKFYFEQGRLCKPENANKEQTGFVKEVNSLIKLKLPQADWIID